MRAGAACIAQKRGLFRTSLRIVTVLLAICALLIRTHVLRMIRLARIAESALARHMSGCMALGTNAVRTRVRVARVSRRGAYRAILWATLVSRHMCVRATVSADHASTLTFLSLSFLTAAAVTDPADDLPAVFRDPADGLSAAFLRPRCWTPNGRTGREQRWKIGNVPEFCVLS